jgi:hypothetical protein
VATTSASSSGLTTACIAVSRAYRVVVRPAGVALLLALGAGAGGAQNVHASLFLATAHGVAMSSEKSSARMADTQNNTVSVGRWHEDTVKITRKIW